MNYNPQPPNYYSARNMIALILTNDWSGNSEYYVPHWMMHFYRFKAAFCWLFRPEPSRDIDVTMKRVDVTYIAGGSYGAPGEPTVHWFEAISVGHGIFSNWWVTIYSDSD